MDAPNAGSGSCTLSEFSSVKQPIKCLICFEDVYGDVTSSFSTAEREKERTKLFACLIKALKLPSENLSAVTDCNVDTNYLRMCINCTKKVQFISPVVETLEKLEETVRSFQNEVKTAFVRSQTAYCRPHSAALASKCRSIQSQVFEGTVTLIFEDKILFVASLQFVLVCVFAFRTS